ncbi:ribosome alternative rescue factor ArfA [Alkalimonas sp.]|uniref:ribosome alternative rescue factor ArfA n=1 Tax=Alkalimonas sp. TaxID=1872453 RepID=UPI00263A5D1E|nr:ribosome alternative rescue factor ArfA [Alkalimonas sp.]MCC5827570.1 ribosome alternative rescue factor ArfA [Alkalimonas sp.]
MSKPAAAEHGRGEIRDNAIKALVTSKVFQTRVVKAKKGKGSYQRKGRNSKDYALVVSTPFTLTPALIKHLPNTLNMR